MAVVGRLVKAGEEEVAAALQPGVPAVAVGPLGAMEELAGLSQEGVVPEAVALVVAAEPMGLEEAVAVQEAAVVAVGSARTAAESRVAVAA